MFRLINRNWNPWRELDALMGVCGRGNGRRRSRPRLEVRREENGLAVVARVPGVGPEDVDVKVHGDRVALSVKAKAPETDGLQCVRREREDPSFERSFRVRYEIDAENVEAQLKNGILTLRLPRVPAEQPKRIEVRVG